MYNHETIKPLPDTAFRLFGLDVKWYGILIVTGALLALYFGLRTAKKLGIKEDFLLDGFILGMLLGILGARIYYVIFQWSYFKNDFKSIFMIRDGGLAIHGAIIAAAIFVVVFSKIRKVDPIKVGEIVAPGFFIGQILGRFGNFFNQEATGPLIGKGALDLDSQRMFLKKLLLPDFIVNQMYIINGESGTGYYHPTFLYEALWNAVGLAIVIILRKKWKNYWVGDGVIFYMVWYSFGRFFIEGMRTDSLMIGVFRQAQIISVFLFVGGIVLFILRRKFNFKPMLYIDEVHANEGKQL